MKKSIVCWIMLLLTMILLPVHADELMDITRAAGYEVSEVNRPKSTIVIDGNTGDILWQDNVDEVRVISNRMFYFLSFQNTYQFSSLDC